MQSMIQYRPLVKLFLKKGYAYYNKNIIYNDHANYYITR